MRIERDLHDGVQPHLSALLVKLGIARDLADGARAARADRRARRRRGGRREELRTLARGVYPPLLRERGLAQALQAFAVTAPVTVRVDGAREPGGLAGGDGGRLLHRPGGDPERDQARRPGRERSTSRSTAGRRRLAFAVVDDGPGFDRRAIEAGVGLVSMEDRIGAAGGELEIARSAGAGTTVQGWVPAV